jgi:hypothetical protein
VVFFAVLVWWIARLWLDEPGVSAAKPVEIEAATLTGGGVETGESEDDSSGSADRDISDEDPKP